MIERFHRPFYLPFRNKVIDKLILLRPPTSFYWMTYLSNLIFLWSIAILIVGGESNQGVEVSIGQAFGWSILVACFGSLITFIVTYFAHRYYAKEVKRVFYSEIEEEQERVFRTAFIGELINIQRDEKEDVDKDEQESQATEHENQTQISIMKKFLNLPAKGWKERDEYREGIIAKKKNPLKEYSIMKLHSKRLNVLEECRAMQMLTLLKRDGK